MLWTIPSELLIVTSIVEFVRFFYTLWRKFSIFTILYERGDPADCRYKLYLIARILVEANRDQSVEHSINQSNNQAISSFVNRSSCRDDGKDCMKSYTNPDFFFELWCRQIQQEVEQKKKVVRKRQQVSVKGMTAASADRNSTHLFICNRFRMTDIEFECCSIIVNGVLLCEQSSRGCC